MSHHDLVCVHGLWHQGAVTAACLAELGVPVVATDADPDLVVAVAEGRFPVAEPRLGELVERGRRTGRLRFLLDEHEAVATAAVLWLAPDVVVDEEDHGDVEPVIEKALALAEHLRDDATLVLAGQTPAGTARHLRRECVRRWPARQPRLAVIPENLRLGEAVDRFLNPDQVIVGVDDASVREVVASVLEPLSDRITFVSTSSAEVAKHALNGYLATSVAFANEIAGIAERVGADASEVERVLRRDPRVGAMAYVSPGGAFGGGTLARDLRYLQRLAEAAGMRVPLVDGVFKANTGHADWAVDACRAVLGGELHGKRVTVLGLTYKAGTNSVRRSVAVHSARCLAAAGAEVVVHDPAEPELPADLREAVTVATTVSDALRGSEVLVIGTAWSVYREIPVETVLARMSRAVVVDADGALRDSMGSHPGVVYRCVGTPVRPQERTAV